MTSEQLFEILIKIQKMKCESQTLELKKALKGTPKRLYDTLSSFSNQDEGGIIVFGIDEEADYAETGVYDAQDLQKKINEQCLQMEPVVRPVLTVAEKDGKMFVVAEIPGLEITERPCFYKGQGRLKGSYCRVGDSDEPMTEYEIYSLEAYRKKYQDDIRPIGKASRAALDANQLTAYLLKLKLDKPNLSLLGEEAVERLMNLLIDSKPSLYACLLFGLYPQAYFPQLCITAVVVPGTELGLLGEHGERFIDNKRIEGTLPQMLEGALSFVRQNMKQSTVINPVTGKREDVSEYPLLAVREAILNALIHRDYSQHTEGMPIRLLMFSDRLEIHNPGGLYGRIGIKNLGKQQTDTRNPALVGAMEVLKLSENRYSGIPVIRRSCQECGLPEPVFADNRGYFSVIFYKEKKGCPASSVKSFDETPQGLSDFSQQERAVLEFCRQRRTRKDLINFLGMKSGTYAIKRYIQPMIDKGSLALTIPDRPGSPKQMYYTVEQLD